jgi:hypothetical protein
MLFSVLCSSTALYAMRTLLRIAPHSVLRSCQAHATHSTQVNATLPPAMPQADVSANVSSSTYAANGATAAQPSDEGGGSRRSSFASLGLGSTAAVPAAAAAASTGAYSSSSAVPAYSSSSSTTNGAVAGGVYSSSTAVKAAPAAAAYPTVSDCLCNTLMKVHFVHSLTVVYVDVPCCLEHSRHYHCSLV